MPNSFETVFLPEAFHISAAHLAALDKAPRLVFILILRRVPQPLQTFCRIFEAPQLSGKCLKVAVFGGLALPHIKTHCCMVFYDHKYNTEEMGGTFLSLGLH